MRGQDLGACFAIVLVGDVRVAPGLALDQHFKTLFEVPLDRLWCAGDPSLAIRDLLGYENLGHAFLPRELPRPNPSYPVNKTGTRAGGC